MATTVARVVKIYNKSGKAVNTSTQLRDVFKDARTAYLERKAELKTAREDAARPPLPTRPASSSPYPEDGTAQRGQYGAQETKHGEAQIAELGLMGFSAPQARQALKETGGSMERAVDWLINHPDASGDYGDDDASEIVAPLLPTRPQSSTSRSPDSDIPADLNTNLTTLQRLLDTAHCTSHSARATIRTLEKDPERMAAVALTLAETSNLLTKFAPKLLPGVLASAGKAFPAVVALLLSPEFLVAVGVSAGVVVVALGGWKVVSYVKGKRKAKAEANANADPKVTAGTDASSAEETADDTSPDVDIEHIPAWRRGIVPEDVATASIGTSVEGELVTPGAGNILSERDREKQNERQERLKEWEQIQKRLAEQGLLLETSSPRSRTPSAERAGAKSPNPVAAFFQRGKQEEVRPYAGT